MFTVGRVSGGGIALALTLLLAAPAVAQTPCTNESVRGAYGFAADGTLTVGGRAVSTNEVGRADFDGAGKFSFVATVLIAGQNLVVNGTGAYEVSADCTCTASYTSVAGNGSFDFVVVNGGDGMIYMDTSPLVVMGGTMTKLGGSTCSLVTMTGPYGYGGTGIVSNGTTTASYAEIGRINFDGEGGLTGVFSGSLPGEKTVAKYSGAYKVNEDCTATATYALEGGQTGSIRFVAVNGGASALFTETTGNASFTGAMSKIQAPAPPPVE